MILTFNPSMLISLPPTMALMYGLLVEAATHLFFRAYSASKTWYMLVLV
jgi:hypothetical protein